MIKTISNKGLKPYWTKNDALFVPQDFEAFRNLRIHPLKGNLKDYRSLDVTGNYRIIFLFENGNAYNLSLEDTH